MCKNDFSYVLHCTEVLFVNPVMPCISHTLQTMRMSVGFVPTSKRISNVHNIVHNPFINISQSNVQVSAARGIKGTLQDQSLYGNSVGQAN